MRVFILRFLRRQSSKVQTTRTSRLSCVSRDLGSALVRPYYYFTASAGSALKLILKAVNSVERSRASALFQCSETAGSYVFCGVLSSGALHLDVPRLGTKAPLSHYEMSLSTCRAPRSPKPPHSPKKDFLRSTQPHLPPTTSNSIEDNAALARSKFADLK